jgi:hypothetical protein
MRLSMIACARRVAICYALTFGLYADPTPVPPKDVPYTDFCDKGGRFGPHNTNLEYHLPDVEKQGDLIYLTYFNAGLRLYDIGFTTLRTRACLKRSDGSFLRRRSSATVRCPTISW